MVYDHNTKAGNRGDVAKHVALMAALFEILGSSSGEPFLFADTFAGYAHNLLRPNKKGSDGWETGIGRLLDSGKVGPIQARSLRFWLDWYVRPRPALQYGTYPGSTIITLDVAAEMKLQDVLQIAAWDISAGPAANLMSTLGTERHHVRTRPATFTEPDVQDADFLFIDPPNQWEHWTDISRFLAKANVDVANCLVWLPLHSTGKRDQAGNTPINPKAAEAWERAHGHQFEGIRVCWGERRTVAQALIGCQLFYRVQHSKAGRAVREAIKEVAELPCWQPRHVGSANEPSKWDYFDLSSESGRSGTRATSS